MNRQEAFDIVWKAFVVEEAPVSMEQDAGGRSKCLYWGAEGRKRCAIGRIVDEEGAKMLQKISDEGDLEFGDSAGLSVCDRRIAEELERRLGKEWVDENLGWLSDLQLAHDGPGFDFIRGGEKDSKRATRDIEQKLRQLAGRSYPPLIVPEEVMA